ncbi:MAG TPA: hypothetical protein VK824_06040 [Planctomycetota bacterium]|nr:hypothetical protein [Planctomycetota bacterium]
MRLRIVLLLTASALVPACRAPILDGPGQVRESRIVLPPLFSSAESADGTSGEWNALLWLAGQEHEGEHRHSRLLPFYWHDEDPPYARNTLLFPLWYSRDGAYETARFWSLLYGYQDNPELRTDYALLPLFYSQRSKVADFHRSGLLFVYDWRHDGPTDDVVFITLLGLATLLHVEAGRPPEGETVPALGRSASRRIEVANLFNLITLFGYDDVGDRREFRALTFLGSEMLSPLRSWRGRGDDPFVREWLFPLYMNVQDESDGWYYVGPLWGQMRDDAGKRTTDWWLAGLLAHTAAPEGDTWRILGIPVSGP